MINVSSFLRGEPRDWDEPKSAKEKPKCTHQEGHSFPIEPSYSEFNRKSYYANYELFSTFTPDEYDRLSMRFPVLDDDEKEENYEKIPNMKIIIIEDEDYKYNKLIEALNRLLDNPHIIRSKSRNGGLSTIKQCYQMDDYFDLIFCDNYMPLFDDENSIHPFANEIIHYIRRTISKDVPICIYSSDEINFEDYDYFIKYDGSLSTDIIEKELKQIFNNMKKSKKSLSKKK